MTEDTMFKYPKTVTERTCANCREWYTNSLGERECLQTSCKDYSDWVERPQSNEVEE